MSKEFVYEPTDILEEVQFDVTPDAFSAPLPCPNGHGPMEAVTATQSLWSGNLTLHYDIYQCSHCDSRLFNG